VRSFQGITPSRCRPSAAVGHEINESAVLSGYSRVDRGPWGYLGYPASIAALASFHLSVAVLNLCMNNGAARSGSVLSHIASNNLETRLFTSSADPVGAGLVASLGRPSGNGVFDRKSAFGERGKHRGNIAVGVVQEASRDLHDVPRASPVRRAGSAGRKRQR
jgi:hypothetical protein